ncbi:igE-binding protein-like [Grammomys surdaster]|uniref:igE-binding protein-like n=1 Tax=Grammomys surdaster TaxID=491861 RepID=UPI0010A03521|nr:igE-binding protein-like [Grammomys surdaster]
MAPAAREPWSKQALIWQVRLHPESLSVVCFVPAGREKRATSGGLYGENRSRATHAEEVPELSADRATERNREPRKKKKVEVAAPQQPKPSAPPSWQTPPLPPPPYVDTSPLSCQPNLQSMCLDIWKEPRIAFPVFQDANNQRYHEPLDFKQLKSLAESVKTYGINASFTQAQLERLAAHAMTPADWMSTVKACLTVGQYLDWKVFYQEFAQQQAVQNQRQGNQAWDLDMLMGQGRFATNQVGYSLQVYEQINNMAVRAWKSLPNRGEVRRQQMLSPIAWKHGLLGENHKN